MVADAGGNQIVNQEVDCWDVTADTLFQNRVFRSNPLAKGIYNVTIKALGSKAVKFDAVDMYK